MKLHTRMLIVLADDLAALGVNAIVIGLSPYWGLNNDDFDELQTLMAQRHPKIRLRIF